MTTRKNTPKKRVRSQKTKTRSRSAVKTTALKRKLHKIKAQPLSKSHIGLYMVTAVVLALIVGSVVNLVKYMQQTEALQPSVVKVEAEAMTGDGATYSDTNASGGKAVKLIASGSISATTATDADRSLVITANGNQCDGAPVMQVAVDGKTVATQLVAATDWTQYNYTLPLDKGSHTIKISYTNPHKKTFTLLWIFTWTVCTRSLRVDSASYIGVEASSSATDNTVTGTSMSPSVSPVSSPSPSTSPSASPSTSTSPSVSPSASPTTQPIVPLGVSGNWTLRFDDEFNGTSLDTTKWAKSWYGGTNNVTSSASNISVADGVLGLTLSDSKTGAIVTTKPGGATTGFTLGAESVWEARILFPSDGTNIYNWPAFWVLNDTAGNTPEEIDIAEPWDGVMQTNYHVGSSNASHSYTGYRDGKFHVWTLRRTTTTMYFYVDGTLVYTLPKAAADNGHAQYAILNVGRTSSGNHTVYGAQSKVQVDYVRAWSS